jgi:hypothetical protein
MRDNRRAYKVLVGDVGKRPLERPRCRWEDNIKMGIQEIQTGGMVWIALTDDKNRCRALVNAVMKLWVS